MRGIDQDSFLAGEHCVERFFETVHVRYDLDVEDSLYGVTGPPEGEIRQSRSLCIDIDLPRGKDHRLGDGRLRDSHPLYRFRALHDK